MEEATPGAEEQEGRKQDEYEIEEDQEGFLPGGFFHLRCADHFYVGEALVAAIESDAGHEHGQQSCYNHCLQDLVLGGVPSYECKHSLKRVSKVSTYP